jgi:hypothetical protein
MVYKYINRYQSRMLSNISILTEHLEDQEKHASRSIIYHTYNILECRPKKKRMFGCINLLRTSRRSRRTWMLQHPWQQLLL